MTIFKLPSGEITNLPFLSHVAAKKKPVILSSGMSTLREVTAAAALFKKNPLIVLHCVSNYPAAPADANLRAMRTMADALKTPIGYSDHTPGIHVALAAVALGACVIEKHLTLDRNLPGPDHQASIEPSEFAALVKGVREVEAALGSGRKEPAASEADTRAVARKSLVAIKPLAKGTILNLEAVATRRPGTGLAPSELKKIIGKKMKRAVAGGTLLTKDMFS
jgi:sialic acid synthase SpsE